MHNDNDSYPECPVCKMLADDTSTPWEYALTVVNDEPDYYGIYSPRTANRMNGNLLAKCESEDVAELIVRSVNALPELLAACVKFVEHINSLPNDTEKCHYLRMALNNRPGEMMIAAISKATGEK